MTLTRELLDALPEQTPEEKHNTEISENPDVPDRSVIIEYRKAIRFWLYRTEVEGTILRFLDGLYSLMNGTVETELPLEVQIAIEEELNFEQALRTQPSFWTAMMNTQNEDS